MRNVHSALRTAIATRFAASAALSDAASGGLHYATAYSATEPFVTFWFVDVVPFRTLRESVPKGFDFRVQFDVYSDSLSPSEAEQIATLVGETYERHALTFADHQFVWVDTMRQGVIGPMRADDDPNVSGWRCTEDYIIKVEHSP